ACGAGTATYCADYVHRRRVWQERAADTAALAVILVLPASDPGLLVLCAAVVYALLTVARGGTGPWPPGLLAALAAVLVQVKFSEGLAALALAVTVTATVTVSARSLRALARNAAVGLGAFVVVSLLAWLAAGQR